jgi:hypothetical protein
MALGGSSEGPVEVWESMTEKVEESEEADVAGQECGGGGRMKSARAVGCLHIMWCFGDRERLMRREWTGLDA